MTTNVPDDSQTFAAYLAKNYIAKKGFKNGTVPEAADLAAASDIVLTRADGLNFQIVCIVDRERNPGKQFGLSRDAIFKIGQQCLKYAGKVNRAQMPVTLQIMEIGPGAMNQADLQRLKALKRPSAFSKVVIAAWAVDTAKKSVWSNAWLNGRLLGRGFIEGVLRAPRVGDADLKPPPPPAVRREMFPILTCGLLAVLVAVFAAEHVFAIGPSSGLLAPSIRTLVALGALNSILVLHDHEWFRLFSATLLHADLVHLLFNGVALYLAGVVLENLVGRAWFLALFIIGALGGSLMSIAINPATTVSVGASGAIMGLLAAAFVSSFRLPTGAQRTQIQFAMLQVLIPSLIPLATTRTGHHVDFGAHLGGVLSGALVGVILLKSWRIESPSPRFVGVAAAIAIAGVAAYALAVVPIQRAFPDYVLETQLIPRAELPKDNADARAKSAALVAKYPRDPRARLWRALALLGDREIDGAEKELRAGLKEEDILTKKFQPELRLRLQALLAFALKASQRKPEAVEAAKPVCAATSLPDVRKSLFELGLCK
jgi:rhomboid protease GluP